eukprot:659370-Hanusia_phi.AAC.1
MSPISKFRHDALLTVMQRRRVARARPQGCREEIPPGAPEPASRGCSGGGSWRDWGPDNGASG